MTEKTPATPSGEWSAGGEDRQLVHDITGGLPSIQRGRDKYLTQWKDEPKETYDLRLRDAIWTPLFDDILTGITSKPFTKEVGFKGDPPQRFEKWAEDIDGEGNSQHVFARQVFHNGIRDRLCGILVDYPAGEAPRTQAEEAKSGRRPYFVRVDEANLIAVYCTVIAGRDTITHARIMEREVVRDGWDEQTIERVRVLEPGAWYLFRKAKDAKANKELWLLEAEGVTTLDYVPLVLFKTGTQPPLIKIARMQIELYRRENNLKSIESRTAFPVYAANGMGRPDEPLVIGPGAILFGGEGGDWQLIEPSGSSMEQVRTSVEGIKTEMRRQGMQPLLPGSGDITATATGVEAAKAHSVVQNWALDLKDALEQAWTMAGDWVGEKVEPEIIVHTDFGIELADIAGDQTLLALHEQRVISREAIIDEMKRRGRLMSDYDAEADKELIDAELDAMMDLLPDPMAAEDDPTGGGTQPPAKPGKPPAAKPAAKQPGKGAMV